MNADQFKVLPQPVQDDIIGHLLAIFDAIKSHEQKPDEKPAEPDTSGVQTSSDLR